MKLKTVLIFLAVAVAGAAFYTLVAAPFLAKRKLASGNGKGAAKLKLVG